MSEGKGSFKISRWSTQPPMPQEVKGTKEAVPLEPETLEQGKLYLCKIRFVKLALFEGWNDDMCCFSLLREDATPMRWSEARYLPGDFAAYEAFDAAGNPPINLWQKTLKTKVPTNWFGMFEEARRKQRAWVGGYDDSSQDVIFSAPLPPSSPPPSNPPSKRGSTYFRASASQEPAANDATPDRERMRSHILGEPEGGAPGYNSPPQTPVPVRSAVPYHPQLSTVNPPNGDEYSEVDENAESVNSGPAPMPGPIAEVDEEVTEETTEETTEEATEETTEVVENVPPPTVEATQPVVEAAVSRRRFLPIGRKRGQSMKQLMNSQIK